MLSVAGLEGFEETLALELSAGAPLTDEVVAAALGAEIVWSEFGAGARSAVDRGRCRGGRRGGVWSRRIGGWRKLSLRPVLEVCGRGLAPPRLERDPGRLPEQGPPPGRLPEPGAAAGAGAGAGAAAAGVAASAGVAAWAALAADDAADSDFALLDRAPYAELPPEPCGAAAGAVGAAGAGAAGVAVGTGAGTGADTAGVGTVAVGAGRPAAQAGWCWSQPVHSPSAPARPWTTAEPGRTIRAPPECGAGWSV